MGEGGIFRDWQSNVRRCFAIFQGVGKNYMAELGAFFTGVSQAQELAIDKLWIENDSTALVAAVLNRTYPWKYMQDWWRVVAYLDSIQWRITHCFREANSAADALATHAAKRRTSTKWDSAPSFVTCMVS
ncbi:uncharacterized protein LOC122665721 [Telopea speciosissima]|uniref:uncharacterized protein LOC122665721 n=1 Tax=Telopea speciosissima TaxID=54955 RepID=UPI001CC5722C|nr:uncharacterized protein LOC122665721 [Telopea speciosissima]